MTEKACPSRVHADPLKFGCASRGLEAVTNRMALGANIPKSGLSITLPYSMRRTSLHLFQRFHKHPIHWIDADEANSRKPVIEDYVQCNADGQREWREQGL